MQGGRNRVTLPVRPSEPARSPLDHAHQSVPASLFYAASGCRVSVRCPACRQKPCWSRGRCWLSGSPRGGGAGRRGRRTRPTAVCAPSRTAFLTGLRPDTTQVWTIGPYFRNVARGQGLDVVTLPQLFRANGYFTSGAGKIFHPGTPSGGFSSSEGGGDMCPGQQLNNTAVCTSGPDKKAAGSWSVPYFFCDQYTNDTVQSPVAQQFPCSGPTWFVFVSLSLLGVFFCRQSGWSTSTAVSTVHLPPFFPPSLAWLWIYGYVHKKGTIHPDAHGTDATPRLTPPPLLLLLTMVARKGPRVGMDACRALLA